MPSGTGGHHAVDNATNALKVSEVKTVKVEIVEDLLNHLTNITEGFASADIEATMRSIAYKLIANKDISLSEQLVIDELSKVVSLSKTNPEITGNSYGFYNSNSNANVNFYDGIIKGITESITTAFGEIENNSHEVDDTEVIDGFTYKTKYLELD